MEMKMKNLFYVQMPSGSTSDLGTFPSFESAEKALYQYAHEQSDGDSDSFNKLVNHMEVVEV